MDEEKRLLVIRISVVDVSDIPGCTLFVDNLDIDMNEERTDACDVTRQIGNPDRSKERSRASFDTEDMI